MSGDKRRHVPVGELLQRLRRGEKVRDIAEDLSRRTGVSISGELVRDVARANGWTFTQARISVCRDKRHLVPVDELLQRLRRGEKVRDIAEDVHKKTGISVSKQLLRRMARENGWTFTRGSGAGPSPLHIPRLGALARRRCQGETLKALAAEAGVSPGTLARRFSEMDSPDDEGEQ